MEARGISKQVELAALAEVKQPTVSYWMNEGPPLPSMAQNLAHRLGVNWRWLMYGKGRRAEGRLEATNPRGALKAALERRGLTIKQLAKLTKYDAGVLQHVVDGTGRASEKMIEAIVRELPELTKEELMDGSDSPVVLADDGMSGSYGAKPTILLPPGMKGFFVPLLSMAQAGTWDASHSDEGYTGDCMFALNVDDRRSFAIKVSGNSMEPEIYEGDVVICSPSKQPTPGCCAVVRTRSDQSFVKFWKRKGDSVILESANPAYKPIQFPVAEIAGAWPVVQRISSGMIQKQ